MRSILLHDTLPSLALHTNVLRVFTVPLLLVTLCCFSLWRSAEWRPSSQVLHFTWRLQLLARCSPEKHWNQSLALYIHSVLFWREFATKTLHSSKLCPALLWNEQCFTALSTSLSCGRKSTLVVWVFITNAVLFCTLRLSPGLGTGFSLAPMQMLFLLGSEWLQRTQ